jgi:basic membrane protein A
VQNIAAQNEEVSVRQWLLLVLVGVLALVGGRAAAAPQAGFSACLVTDIGGLNDKSFNHDAYLGLLQAKSKLHIQGRVIQSKSPADYIPNLKACVQHGAGITIAVGFLMTDAIDAIGKAFPQNKFAIVDVDVATLKHHPKSVLGLIFKEQQAGYLVGYGAGLWAKQQGASAVGSVGGLKIPPVDRYIAGFQYGAKKADPGIKTLNGYSQDFVHQNKCKEAALNQIAAGSVVEFQVAGQCGLGVLDAAHEKGVYGIGADADQGYLGKWVMTSALKRVDVSVFTAIKQAKGASFRGGRNEVFTANNNGVGVGKWAQGVPASIRAAVAKQFKLLKAGKIRGIPTTVK